MKRRLDYIHRADNAIFIDDYAHHPNEISATISSLREMYPENTSQEFSNHTYILELKILLMVLQKH